MSAVRTIYIELRASAEKLAKDMQDATQNLDKVGASGQQAGRQISGGMQSASESFGKVARNATEAALAMDNLIKLTARYSSLAAASGSTTEGLLNTFRALRIALSPTPFTVATVATGVLIEETVRLINARAKLIEQQALISAKGGGSIGNVEILHAAAGISGGNESTLRTLGTDPNELAKIARQFESIADPAKRAEVAVRLFGEHAGDALRELTPEFANAVEAANRFGLTLNSVSRTQIDTFRRDMLSLKSVFTDWSVLDSAAEKFKQRMAEIGAATYDGAKRGTSALAELIDKYTGLGGLGALQTLTAGDTDRAGASRADVDQGEKGVALFAQAQLAHFRQSQTLEGRQTAQAAAQARADAAYAQLQADAQKRQQNPNDSTLLSGQQRFSLATQQQSAQTEANSIGLRVKAMQDQIEAANKAAEALKQLQEHAKESARQSFEEQVSSFEEQDAARNEQNRQAFEEQVQYYEEQDQARNEFNKKMADIAEEGLDLEDRVNAEIATQNEKRSELAAKGTAQSAEGKNAADRLQIERAYALEVGHTGQERISYMQQLMQLQAELGKVRENELRADIEAANIAGDTDKAKELQIELEKQITDQKNQQYKSATDILATQQQQDRLKSTIGSAKQTLDDWQRNAGIPGIQAAGINAGMALPAELSNALANAMFGGKKGEDIGKQVADAVKNAGKQLLGNVFTQIVEKLIAELAASVGITIIQSGSQNANTVALGANTAALVALTASMGVSGGVGAAGGAAGAVGSAASAFTSAATGFISQFGGLIGGLGGGVISGVMGLIGDARIVNAIHETTAAVNALRISGGTGTLGANGTTSSTTNSTNGQPVGGGLAGMLESFFGFGSSNPIPVSIVSISPLSPISGLFHLFANGGRVARGMPSIVGDGGKPEVFMPDEAGTIFPSTADYMSARGSARSTGWAAAGSSSVHNVGGSHTINIYETRDAQDTARQVAQFLKTAVPGAIAYNNG